LAALLVLAPCVAASATPALVEEGRRLFLAETFDGNGRTCGTCHPATNNYTIDPAFIARLPADDPLFVAERVPALRGLERSLLLRKLGLVVVHADGFAKPGVLRGVPHTLGMRRSIRVDPFNLTPPGGDRDLIAATGWSGDGAPGAGSLREFTIGAIREHLPKTLRRRPGVDFRLPTERELDAIRAFILSLGRQQEVDISDATGMRFAASLVERGRVLFNSERSGPCNFCHNNAGALNDAGNNASFDTGVAHRPDSPALRLDATLPADGGFGASPVVRIGGRTGHGDGRMNVPSLVEAADTPPFFHDNSAATLEKAVAFYTTPTFAQSPEGQALPVIDLTLADQRAIAAMLRTLNAMENIRSGNAMLRDALRLPDARARALVRLASLDTRDAIQALGGGPLELYPGARVLLRQALALERRAFQPLPSGARRDLLRQATVLKDRARPLLTR
jgi:hypothetical protein